MRSPDRTEGHRSAKAPQKTLGLWSKMRFPNRYNINFSRAISGLTGHAKTSKNIGIIDMSDDTHAAFMFGMAFGVLLSAVPWVFLGGSMMKHDLQNLAIEAKVGEYDSQTGEFKYKILEENDKK